MMATTHTSSIVMGTKVVRLPNLEPIAPTMSEVFGPDDCPLNEVVVRGCRLMRSGVSDHDTVMAVIMRNQASGGANVLVTMYIDERWDERLCMAGDDYDLLVAVTKDVIEAP